MVLVGFSYNDISSLSLDFDSNNFPYVAYIIAANSASSIVLAKYNGSNWVNIGYPTGLLSGQIEGVSLKIDSNDIPYIAYSDYTKSQKATVVKWDGFGWIPVGTSGFSADQAYYISLALDSADYPVVLYKDSGNNYKATVMKYDGTNWINIGNAGFSQGAVEYTSLALDSSNTPYVSYQDDANNSKVTVMKYQ